MSWCRKRPDVRLLNPADPIADERLRELQAIVRNLEVQLQVLYAGTDREIDAALATLASGGELLVNADPFLFIRRAQLTALAARHAVPAIYYDRELPSAAA